MQGACCSGAWQLSLLPALACFAPLRGYSATYAFAAVAAKSMSNSLRSVNASRPFQWRRDCVGLDFAIASVAEEAVCVCTQLEAELAKVRRIATEATEEGARLADLAARASKDKAITDAHTREVGPGSVPVK